MGCQVRSALPVRSSLPLVRNRRHWPERGPVRREQSMRVRGEIVSTGDGTAPPAVRGLALAGQIRRAAEAGEAVAEVPVRSYTP
jgi:hypothetical protein